MTYGPRNIDVYANYSHTRWYWQCNRDECYDWEFNEHLDGSDGDEFSWREAFDQAWAHHVKNHRDPNKGEPL